MTTCTGLGQSSSPEMQSGKFLWHLYTLKKDDKSILEPLHEGLVVRLDNNFTLGIKILKCEF